MKKTVFKKIAALLLVFVLILSLAACKSGSKDVEITLPEKKVAILVAP